MINDTHIMIVALIIAVAMAAVSVMERGAVTLLP
jgi:hypothetical protein